MRRAYHFSVVRALVETKLCLLSEVLRERPAAGDADLRLKGTSDALSHLRF